ncbi:hypothetical protein EAF04_008308 [Stromatinia cepivora]|nr:hypothetical protein EAF04_008308 [Stromatinia cepivora]
MARMLAPIVRYNDAQWRAIKSKANGNHPSLKPEDIEIIKEVIRVHNAILNNTDPTPLPQFQNSIKYDERQVIKFFLWGRIEQYGSTFTLVSTFYLPKRRPDGRGGKHQKQADAVMRPRRSSLGNTFGFVRKPERKVDDAFVDASAQNGEKNGSLEGENGVEGNDVIGNGNRSESGSGNGTPAAGSSPLAKNNPAGKNSPGGKKRIVRLKLRSNTSNEFVRRSERRVGGAVNKNVDISMGGIGEVDMNEDMGNTKDKRSSKGSTGSKGSSDSALGDEMSDIPVENSTVSNNTYVSTFIPLSTVYKSPYAPIPEVNNKVPSRESTISAEDIDNTYGSSFVAEDKRRGSNSTISAEDSEEYIPPRTTNKLPYDPFFNAGYQIEDRDRTFSTLGAEEHNHARFEKRGSGESELAVESPPVENTSEMSAANPHKLVDEALESMEMDW